MVQFRDDVIFIASSVNLFYNPMANFDLIPKVPENSSFWIPKCVINIDNYF